MRKVLHFDSPREVYTADACVISCFDARFDVAVRKFLRRSGIELYDQVKIPGSVKALANPDREADRDFVLRMVHTSIRLHAPKRAVLLAHNDCGAYPGSPVEVVTTDVVRAAEVLRSAVPELAVGCYFADFDGIFELP
jgi:hypothetical protein